jgi:DNA-binding transcriptional LysR family regulator
MQEVHLAGVDLNLLVALDALLETRHVTQAAKRIGLTQSATSHALGRLRELLGDPLLVRAGAVLVPTPRALELAPEVRAILASIRRTLSPAAFDPSTAARTFTIATADYIELVLLPSLVAELGRTAPLVDLVVRPPPEPAGLATGELDLAIGVGVTDAPSIQRRKLFVDRLACVVREGHPVLRGRGRARRERPSLDLERFLGLGHVFITVYGTRGGAVDDALAKKKMKRRVVAMVPSFLAAPAIVAESDLVLTMPARLAASLAPAYGLRILEPPIELGEYEVTMYWHARMQRDPAHVWLRQLVADCGARLP